jgi:hypothetical protein
MAYLKFAEKGKTVEVSKDGKSVAWLRNHGGRWNLYRVEDALTMDELALVRQYALERS